MDFTKYHISGRDYIFIPDGNDFGRLSEADIIRLCDRQKGVGADGIFTFHQNNPKTGHLRGFCKNGNIMRDFSSVSICAVFEAFLTANIAEYSFLSENGHKITVNTAFSEKNPIFFCTIDIPPADGIFKETGRKTEIGNRILTITPVDIAGIYAVHFTECRDKLNIHYLGQHISSNSLFRKEANLILAQKNGEHSFEISFYENSTGCSRPDLSAFAGTALAACKNGVCNFKDAISVSCNNNTLEVICHSPESITVKCTCEKVFTGRI